ncbi:hypothetical protein [Brevibacillus dissolubilis]|nr:hypothetical protein [Brevibacillus dissolubilis]
MPYVIAVLILTLWVAVMGSVVNMSEEKQRLVSSHDERKIEMVTLSLKR